MAVTLTTLESNLQTKLNNTSGTTDAQEFLLLSKSVEALNPSIAVQDVIDEGTTQVAAVTSAGTTQVGLVQTEGTTQVGLVQTEGATQVAAVQAAGSGYATQADIDASVSALVDSAPATLDTLNELAAALGDDANFSTTVTNSIATKLPLAGGTLTGGLTAPSVTVNGTLNIEEVVEKVLTSTSTSGTLNMELVGDDGAIFFTTSNQTANRTINFRGDGSTTLNNSMAVGESFTSTVLMTQGSTAYYLNAYQVDGTAVTPKWSGGSAPTAGNASGIDVYTFTIIKTADATFTVLASQTQYA